MAGVTVPVDVLVFLEVVELLELLGELDDDALSGRAGNAGERSFARRKASSKARITPGRRWFSLHRDPTRGITGSQEGVSGMSIGSSTGPTLAFSPVSVAGSSGSLWVSLVGPGTSVTAWVTCGSYIIAGRFRQSVSTVWLRSSMVSSAGPVVTSTPSSGSLSSVRASRGSSNPSIGDPRVARALTMVCIRPVAACGVSSVLSICGI